MKNLLCLAIITLLSSQAIASNVQVYAFPQNMESEFRKNVRSHIEGFVKEMKKGDEILLFSYPLENHCSYVSKVDNSRRNIKAYGSLAYKIGSACKDIISSLKRTSDVPTKNDLDIPVVTNKIIDALSDRNAVDITFFSSGIYQNQTVRIYFNKGYPSLGHIGKSAKYLSPFSVHGKYISKNKVSVHLLFPSDDADKYLTDLDQGALFHESKVKYFWYRFFESRNLDLRSYNTVLNGKTNSGLVIENDQDYEVTKNGVFFVDLNEIARKKSAESGTTFKVIEGDENYSSTQKEYQYELDSSGALASIYIREFDADADADGNGLKLKIVAITISGSSEVQYVSPSGENEWQEHTVKIETREPVTSIALYPVDKDGNVDAFGGAWTLGDLWVNFL